MGQSTIGRCRGECDYCPRRAALVCETCRSRLCRQHKVCPGCGSDETRGVCLSPLHRMATMVFAELSREAMEFFFVLAIVLGFLSGYFREKR